MTKNKSEVTELCQQWEDKLDLELIRAYVSRRLSENRNRREGKAF